MLLKWPDGTLVGGPLVSTVLVGAIIFLVTFFACYWPRRNKTFDFDPGGRYGAFENHAKRYQALARLVLTLATASVAFLLNFLVNLNTEAKSRSVYSLKLESASPRAIACLCLSAVSTVLFLLLENFFYEDYVHFKYTSDPARSKETYTGARYAINLTLAWTGLFWFFSAFMYLAYRLFD